MKRNYLLLLLLSTISSNAQSGDWVWLHGQNTGSSMGNYGIQGVSSPTNEIPGRYQAAYWLDFTGKFWVFGSSNSSMNDLWRYDPSINEWTWMKGPQGGANPGGVFGVKGVSSPLNNPPDLGYGANCWTGPDGHLYLFGGGSSAGAYNTLWKYNISSNEWTWIGGSDQVGGARVFGAKSVFDNLNDPGALSECKSGWVYDNKLWLFGGLDDFVDVNNCIWSYDLNLQQWAWQAGSQIPNAPGVYGTMGVSSPLNEPPARMSYTKWQTKDDFFIFAGGDFNLSDGRNDVWILNKATKDWTWVSGTNIINDLGTLNPTFCNPSVNNFPSSRIENQTAQSASSCNKAFWTFGGFNPSGQKFHNDLWLFNTTNYEWTKVKGEAAVWGISVASSYGIKGVIASSNLPPGRGGHCMWTDNLGQVYVFGGGGGPFKYFSDMWKFIPDTTCFNTGLVSVVNLLPPSNTNLCPGDTATIVLPTNANVVVNPASNISIQPNILKLFPTTNTTYTVMANSMNPNDPCFKGDTKEFTLNYGALPHSEFNTTPSIANINNAVFSFINTSTNANKYEWYDANYALLSTNKDYQFNGTNAGTFCFHLVAISACGDQDTSTKCVKVVENLELVMPSAFTPNADNLNKTIKPIFIGDFSSVKYDFRIFNRWGEEIFKTTDYKAGWDGLFQTQKCDVGVYYYLIKTINEFGDDILYKGEVSLIE